MATTPTTETTKPRPVTVEEEFRHLAEIWRKETAHLSSTTKINNHPAYQAIIALGPAVIPFLLREVAATHEFWFQALKCITGESPVPPEAYGKIDQVAAAWLQWGREHGYACE